MSTVAELLVPGVYHANCKACGRRWQLQPSDPLPGRELACPECRTNGANIVLDFEAQGELL